jgi:hypothetical protein
VPKRAFLENTMQIQHPDPFEAVSLSRQHYMKLGCAAMFTDKAEWQVVEEAIDEWMRRFAPDACGEPEFAGYQWKSVFLPHETVLRTTFKGKNHHCRVENDQIIYEGKTLSPSGFVNAVGGIRRNAWKSVWVLLPDTKHWQLADTLRVRRGPPASRKAARVARPAKASPAPTQPTVRAADARPVPPTPYYGHAPSRTPITAPAPAPRKPPAPMARTGQDRRKASTLASP